jgi:hypothetical protein
MPPFMVSAAFRIISGFVTRRENTAFKGAANL